MAKQQPSKDCSFPGCSYKIKMSSGVSGAYMHLMSHYQRTTYKTRDDICRNSNPEHICIDANMFCVRETAARLMLGNVTHGGQPQAPTPGTPAPISQQQVSATGGPTSRETQPIAMAQLAEHTLGAREELAAQMEELTQLQRRLAAAVAEAHAGRIAADIAAQAARTTADITAQAARTAADVAALERAENMKASMSEATHLLTEQLRLIAEAQAARTATGTQAAGDHKPERKPKRERSRGPSPVRTHTASWHDSAKTKHERPQQQTIS